MAYLTSSIVQGIGAPLTVPDAAKRIFQLQGGPVLLDPLGNPYSPNLNGFFRITQIQIVVLTQGAHANFVVTLEGAYEQTANPAWKDVFTAIPSIQDTTGITLDSGGLHLTAARALAGMVFPLDLAFPRMRMGIAGDNAAPGGSARIQWRSSR